MYLCVPVKAKRFGTTTLTTDFYPFEPFLMLSVKYCMALFLCKTELCFCSVINLVCTFLLEFNLVRTSEGFEGYKMEVN